MIIIGGIYFELQTPGIGFPSAAALIAAVLYFAPLYLDGLAANWEILLFVAGVVMLILEIFVIPGFGIAGISGIVLMIGALVLALLGNVNFNFDYVESGDINRSILIVVIGLIMGTAVMIYLSHKIGRKGIFNRLALHATQDIDEGFIAVPSGLDKRVGAIGIASTILRPSGKIRIEDVDYDAVALYGYIEKGTPVRVIKTGNSQLYVLPVDKK